MPASYYSRFASVRVGLPLALCLGMGLGALRPYAGQAAVPGDSTPRPRPFYVGVQLASLRFGGLGQFGANGEPLAVRGLMPVVGWQVAPRWQLEAAAWWRRPAQSATTVTNSPNGDVYRYYYTEQSWVVPLLVRFSLLPRLRHWRVEGLAGLTLLHMYSESQQSLTLAGQSPQPFTVGSTDEVNDSPLTLGAGVAYDAAPHWTLRADGRLDWSLVGSLVQNVFFGGGGYAPQPGVSAGVAYRFGLRGRR